METTKVLSLYTLRRCGVEEGWRGLLRLGRGEDFDCRVTKLIQSSLEYVG